jgi:large conductance mechanosensitive channel
MKGFIEFIKKQGVIGLAVGFILGGAVSKVVASFVEDIVNPIVGILLKKSGTLATVSIDIGSAKIMLGHFISIVINFLIIAFVVYFGIKWLKLDKLDDKLAEKK